MFFTTSIDFSNFSTSKLERFDSIFNNCKNLSYIDISSFPGSLNYTKEDFGNISNTGTIKVNKNISAKIKDIFENLNMNWAIIEN